MSQWILHGNTFGIRAILVACALFLSTPTFGADDTALSAERARDLIQRAEDMYRSASSRAVMSMRIETPNYQRTLNMEVATLGEEKMFIRILSPKKDRGIATLKQDNEMWNYFPKINKVIKVPPSMMMGSWMGSDFTNDDLVKETTLVDEYQLSLQETAAEWLVTLIPRERTITVWGKMEVTIDKQNLTPIKRTFYDEDGTMVRIMNYREPKQFGDITLPSVMEMIPLNKTGNRTLVIYEELELNASDVSEDQFTLRQLKQRFR